MKGKVLVAGFATRHVVQSAYAAGYEVVAVDHFCDRDLFLYARDAVAFAELDEIPAAVDEMARRHRPDLLVVTSGGEALASREICGTSPARAARFLDKLLTHRFFEEIDIPAPALLAEGTYPAMQKPRSGSGGWRNRIVRDDADREAWFAEFGDVPALSEEIVDGTPCSVSCIADGTRAVAIAVNRQVLRGVAGAEFGYSGSLTPYRSPGGSGLVALAESIAAASGCTGTLGIDFVEGGRITAIEVNPRFQATLDTIEMATGINIFSAHVNGCRGFLPGSLPACRLTAARKILFADRTVRIESDLLRLHPIIADIPAPGSEFSEGQAVISVYGWGAGEEQALSCLDKHIKTVSQYMGGKVLC